MKTDLHPELFDTHVTCTCGNSFTTRATVERLQLDICSNCHPFFTGTQKLVDTQGQVERFQQRLKKAGRRAPAQPVPTPAEEETNAQDLIEAED
ncbi:MAG: 50S ribosomal protein L31 [Chloroflexi bacterium]|nr:50S ribosomal protein L31 [Chloroflexota bacterium]